MYVIYYTRYVCQGVFFADLVRVGQLSFTKDKLSSRLRTIKGRPPTQGLPFICFIRFKIYPVKFRRVVFVYSGEHLIMGLKLRCNFIYRKYF